MHCCCAQVMHPSCAVLHIALRGVHDCISILYRISRRYAMQGPCNAAWLLQCISLEYGRMLRTSPVYVHSGTEQATSLFVMASPPLWVSMHHAVCCPT